MPTGVAALSLDNYLPLLMNSLTYKADESGYVSPEDYLRHEREAVNKHEYFHGTVRAMAGARRAHNALCFRLNGLLFPQLDERGCVGYTSDQRVQVLNASSYLYPDFSALCGESEFNDDKTPENLLNPTLIVEVLSASTADKDRGEKFMLYRQIPSLQQYLMLDSTTMHAELYTRQSNHYWLMMETRDLATVLDLSSVGCTLPLARLYQGVALDTNADAA
jgi:Uma2 family endonuclease